MALLALAYSELPGLECPEILEALSKLGYLPLQGLYFSDLVFCPSCVGHSGVLRRTYVLFYSVGPSEELQPHCY